MFKFLTIIFLMFFYTEALAYSKGNFNEYKKSLDLLLSMEYIDQSAYYKDLYNKLLEVGDFPGRSNLLSRYKSLAKDGSPMSQQQSSYKPISLPKFSTILINLNEIHSGAFNNGECLKGSRGQIAKCISDYYRRSNLDRQKAITWFVEAKLNDDQLDKSLFLKHLFEEDTRLTNGYKVSLVNLIDQYEHLESMHPYYKNSYEKFWSWLSESNTFGDSKIKQSNYRSNTSIDTKAPIISLDQNDFVTVEGSIINLSGFIEDDSNVSEVNINGGLISIDDSGKFDRKMYLGLGKNKFTIEALDIFGNKVSKIITVVRNQAIVKNKDKKLTPPTTQLASNPNSVALIIGLDDYKSMPNAPWAESDASAFYDYAHNVLGIPFDRIRLITGQESDGIGIWKSLEQWLPSQVDKNKSNIYVYFAGHGLASEDGKEAYLMPYDGDTSMLSRTAIPRKDIISGLDKLQARSVTLFMDTCYSGATKGGKQSLVASRGLRIVKKDVLSDLPANFTLFSAAANDETAISHPTQKNGLFSYWMMRGLGGEADSNNDDKLTNGELHAFISEKVQKTAISKGHIQHPQLIGNKDKVITSW